MAVLWKLLYYFKYYVRYLTCALLLLFLFLLIHVWSMRFSVEYKDVVPGIQVFSYKDAQLSNAAPKYILFWEKYYMEVHKTGQQIFSSLQCRVNNCIYTEDKDLLDDYTRFDAIVFSDITLVRQKDRPTKRARSQIYIFSTIESPYNSPACELFNDDFFNWTFTYRLDSDIYWGYFIVRNTTHHIVAPSKDVQWETNKSPISPSIQNILRQKTKAAAWLVSHCDADSMRDAYVTQLQEHLFHYSLKIDVFGACTNAKCIDDDCEEMFSKHYYFYIAFENSFGEDYVTEKVLHGYDNYVVPIVYGGANYSRFLPPGSYLNARELHPYNLAFLIYEAIQDPAKYEEYFRWTNSYTIDSDLPGYHALCSLCEALNSGMAKRTRRYKKFRVWWNALNGMKWCLPTAYRFKTSFLNVEAQHLFELY